MTDSIAITFFPSFAAETKAERMWSLDRLAERIRSTTAPEKARLPWLKLARFGDRRTSKGSLRNDANLLAISGIEADYDGELVTFDDARGGLEQQGVASILYTSPSHTEDTPRWRVLCPLSSEMPPQQRNHHLGRLNGLFRGIFSNESWTLSQSYYFGSVGRNPSHRVEVIDGQPIDLHDDLDTIWIGKPGATTNAVVANDVAGREAREDAELVRCIVTGEHLHVELCALAARYIGRSIPPDTVEEMLRGMMLSQPEGARDERWLDRYYSIPALVGSAFRKYRGDDAAKRKPVVALAFRLLRERRPSAEVEAAVIREGAENGIPADTATRIAEWCAKRELERRGAAHA